LFNYEEKISAIFAEQNLCGEITKNSSKVSEIVLMQTTNCQSLLLLLKGHFFQENVYSEHISPLTIERKKYNLTNLKLNQRSLRQSVSCSF
jgi:hypothetical protein